MLMDRYPSIMDLEKRARRRIPFFAWEYLDSGTGREESLDRNLEAFRQISLVPKQMMGVLDPELSTELFGTKYAAPFGIAPIGLSSLMWPNAENILAKTAAKNNIPYALSTVATRTPEEIGPIANDMGWFQLYPPREAELRNDLLARARKSGFKVLLITSDVPVTSRRERQRRAGLTIPRKLTPSTIFRSAIRPEWAMATLMAGQPRFRTLEKYADASQMSKVAEFIGANLGGTLSWEYLEETRKEWDGPILIKGVLSAEDAERAACLGMDGVVVSNHGGRQFDGAPSPLEVLPEIRSVVGDKMSILMDSGIRSSLDIARAIALGADFVLLGRAFMFGVAALGARGGDHVTQILLDELKNVMTQLGCPTINSLSKVDRRVPDGAPPAGIQRLGA